MLYEIINMTCELQCRANNTHKQNKAIQDFNFYFALFTVFGKSKNNHIGLHGRWIIHNLTSTPT
jgi:hypothetical protein